FATTLSTSSLGLLQWARQLEHSKDYFIDADVIDALRAASQIPEWPGREVTASLAFMRGTLAMAREMEPHAYNHIQRAKTGLPPKFEGIPEFLDGRLQVVSHQITTAEALTSAAALPAETVSTAYSHVRDAMMG